MPRSEDIVDRDLAIFAHGVVNISEIATFLPFLASETKVWKRSKTENRHSWTLPRIGLRAGSNGIQAPKRTECGDPVAAWSGSRTSWMEVIWEVVGAPCQCSRTPKSRFFMQTCLNKFLSIRTSSQTFLTLPDHQGLYVPLFLPSSPLRHSGWTYEMLDSLSYVAHEPAANLHPWPNSPYTTLQKYFWDPLQCLGKVLKNMRSNPWQLYQSLLGYEFPPDPPSCESPNVQKTIFEGKSSLTCLFSKTISAGFGIDRIGLNFSDAFSRLKNG